MARATSATAATTAATARRRTAVEPRSARSGSRTLPSLALESKCGHPATPPDEARGLLHAEGPLRLPGEKLPHKLVVGIEEVAGRARFHDPPLPQDRDVVGH